MKRATLSVVGGRSPKPLPSHGFATLSPEARQLLAEGSAIASRLRVLETTPTLASVAWAKVAIPALRDLLARLEKELPQ